MPSHALRSRHEREWHEQRASNGAGCVRCVETAAHATDVACARGDGSYEDWQRAAHARCGNANQGKGQQPCDDADVRLDDGERPRTMRQRDRCSDAKHRHSDLDQRVEIQGTPGRFRLPSEDRAPDGQPAEERTDGRCHGVDVDADDQ